MRVSEYHDFVRRTDQFSKRSAEDRRLIALYGVVGEIGSLGAAVKKKLLGEDGEREWNRPNDEIVEELGDTIWYCFSLAQIANEGQSFNVLLNDLEELQREISGTNDRAETIRATLNAGNKMAFLAAYAARAPNPDIQFAEYQKLTFLTARTQGRELFGVCVAILWQLAAELLRKTLPDIELTINQRLEDRPINIVIGAICWHLCAVASVLDLSIDDVIAKNLEKVNFRANRDNPTPHHDEGRKESEQLPRKFEISIVSIQKRKSRMYYRGQRLGDDLSDNSWEDDGYRFHDVLHLSNVAHLGWSPVIRGFMKRKRKSDEQLDQVEDGARAVLVEELVLKAIHSEGERLAQESGRCDVEGRARQFPAPSLISFKLLKTIRGHVLGHEVHKNQYWEWEDAIFDGSEIYHKLRIEQQGTICVDMEARKITFSPDVFLDLRGATVGLGLGRANTGANAPEADLVLTEKDRTWAVDNGGLARALSAKHAIYAALKLPANDWKDMDIKVLPDGRVCVQARGAVQSRMWEIGAISFQLAFAEADGSWSATIRTTG
ncbi:MAG: hypothetical protein ACREU3_12905 [Steroidobacteraceae bacterium]